MLRPALIAFLVAVPLLVVGCGGGDGSSATYTKSDLGALVLKPTEAPKGVEYSRRDSGLGALERANGEAAVGPLRKYGLQADYVTKFLATGKQGGVVFAESIALVFKSSDGAKKAVALAKQQASGGGSRSKPVSADGLGDEGWGKHGSFFAANAPDTYFYTWRTGNAVQSLILAGTVSEKQAHSLAERLDRRAKTAA